MIAILDYGIGNIGSIKNMLKRIGVESMLTDDINVINSAEKIILPGIGNFDYCMSQLKKARFYSELEGIVLEQKKPTLGVCVGMQMLFESSEEGSSLGLGWLKGNVVKFKLSDMEITENRIPHMGWSEIEIMKKTPITIGLEDARFYFVHSYHAQVKLSSNDVLFKTNYGYDFVSGVEKDNIIGVQFHPEKSHKFGMRLYKNFVENY